MDFTVISDLNDNMLSVRADGRFKTGDLFYCYLLRYGQVVERAKTWQASAQYRWELTEPGLYSAQLHVKRGQDNTRRYSRPVQFSSKHERTRFRHEIANTQTQNFPELPVYAPTYPFQNICLIRSSNPLDRRFLDTIDHTLGMQTAFFADAHLCVLSDRELKHDKNMRYGVSGIFSKNDRLFFGENDVHSEEHFPLHEIGSYTFVRAKDDEVNLATDYFGVTKLYLFQSHKLTATSNNYHLLIRTLKLLGGQLSINKTRAIANFAFVNVQPFHQAFCRQTNMRSIQIIAPGHSIAITKQKLSFTQTPLLQDLNPSEPVDLDEYSRLVQSAKTEIINNVKAALEHPSFESVIVDLSGGMDSRAVFAAVTHHPQHRDRVRIHSRFSVTEPLDLDVALSLCRLYGYKYDDLPAQRAFRFGETPWDAAWSYNLGQYFSHTPNPIITSMSNTIRLVGFYGEICARPYYSRSYLNGELDVPDNETFAKGYLARLYHFSLTSRETGCLDALHGYFLEELNCLPGATALERFETHYLYYRNALHCNGAFRNEFSCAEWGPLQSKHLFRAKHSTFQRFKSVKAELDLIELTNPVVAAHVYQSENDNDARRWVRDNQGLMGGSAFTVNLHLPCVDDKKRWLDAENRKRSGITTRPSSQDYETYSQLDAKRNEIFKVGLTLLVQKRLLHERLAFDLWVFFERFHENGSMRPQVWNLINRVVSLAYESSYAE